MVAYGIKKQCLARFCLSEIGLRLGGALDTIFRHDMKRQELPIFYIFILPHLAGHFYTPW